MDSLYLVMPAYNEEANIEDVVRAWYPIVADKGEDSRMVIADSGSSDGTHNKLEALQREFPKLEVLSNTGKQHGPKVIALYKYAIDRGATYIFQTDSDGQTNPAEFASFWKLRERYAGIFGFRKERGDGKIRAFVERVVCLLLGLYFHVSVPDANAPFRLMRAEVVAKYLPRMAADYNLPNIMLTTFFSYYGERIRFRKITFKPRQGGVNSVNVRKIIGIGIKALGDFHAFKKAMLADEAPVETLETWDPDAETTLEDDIPDMPKTVYVMKDAGSVLKSEKPETEDAESVPETEDAESVPETENAESVTETEKPETEAAQSVAETPDAADKAASVAETPDAADKAASVTETPDAADEAESVTETPDAQADTGDAPEAVETRTKPKGVPRKHPANKKTDKKGSRKPRKVALKPRNGKES
ncbi:MAG: glycosyltransferase [Oscillibacter sp.]|nr:glycosyltransferase [Oscillibacter sp.]